MCVCVFFCSVPVQICSSCAKIQGPLLVVKRGQVGANCPDCQLSAAVGLFIHTENSLSHTNIEISILLYTLSQVRVTDN